MKTAQKLHSSIDQSIEKVTDYLEQLPVRDRYLLVCTCIVVLVTAIAASLWFMHAAANKQQNRVNDLKDTLVWMQSNAVTMKPVDDLQLTAAEKVQRVAQQQDCRWLHNNRVSRFSWWRYTRIMQFWLTF